MQVLLPRALRRPSDIWGRQRNGGTGVRRHNQGLINILIAAAAPLAPQPGHTHTHSIWKQRLSRGEEHRRGANQTYFNSMLKITVATFPSVWGATGHVSMHLLSSRLHAWWCGFSPPTLRTKLSSLLVGPGRGKGFAGRTSICWSVPCKWHFLQENPRPRGNLSLNRCAN